MAFRGGDWRAQVVMSPGSDGWINAVVYVDGSSGAAALAGAKAAYESVAAGKERCVRHAPSVETTRDFETCSDLYRGFVRFSFKNVAGVERMAAPLGDGTILFGIGAP